MMLLLAVLGTAQASTFGAMLYVPDQAPAGMPSGQVLGSGLNWSGIARGAPDVTVTSDFPYVTCAVESGDVRVTFAATADDYPMEIPSRATCTHGDYTLRIDLVPITPGAHTPFDVDPAMGVSYDVTPTIGDHPTASYHVHRLPSSMPFVEGPGVARLSSSQAWTGVECGVAPRSINGEPRLWTWILPEAVAGSGYCLLNTDSGVPYAVPVSVARD